MIGTIPLLGKKVGSKHGPVGLYPSYKGLVMAGYQGWFRTPGDGSNAGFRHYGFGADGESSSIDMWPDVSEYEKTYETGYTNPDGTKARVFSSLDASTTNLHFRWMKEYGVDGVFMQRFFGVTRSKDRNKSANTILRNALKASQENGRAIAVMYDLSGLKAKGEDCSSVIEDWKRLVDDMKVTSQGDGQTYLHHNGKPLVAIWGLGFPDRPYDIRKIGFERLLDFLKNDPEYGGCSIMLGVPAYFRRLAVDANPEPYLHELMAQADVIMPWNPQRYTPLLHAEMERFATNVRDDKAWCEEKGLDYAPCVYPGFTWYNISRNKFGGAHPLNQIPRQKGKFYWGSIEAAVSAGAEMLYVAMFDEVDEGTAIMKVACEPPLSKGDVHFVGLEDGVPSDHFLWLTGEGGRLLRGDLKSDPDRYLRLNPLTRNQ
ncbi:glycoside hydrolase family 71/99-like protein [Pelagicoccus mobilis]|uniref:glycoside hydrolase family 71/99-like protein n=1 Tax=Pelagicoccus mobilis TaxID=415221 RepID=UPI00366EE2EE